MADRGELPVGTRCAYLISATGAGPRRGTLVPCTVVEHRPVRVLVRFDDGARKLVGLQSLVLVGEAPR